MTYFWIFPDGSVSDEKNPLSTKLEYGQYEILLFTYDDITGEIASSIIQIDHRPIPKKAKSSSKSTKYTLDIKDVPEDIGGGVALDTDMTLKGLIAQIILVFIL